MGESSWASRGQPGRCWVEKPARSPPEGREEPLCYPRRVQAEDLCHPLESKRGIVAPKKKALSAPYVTRKGFPSKSFEPFLGRRVLVVTSRRRTSLKRDPLAPYPTQYWRVNRLKEQMGPLSATKYRGRPLLRSRWGFDSTKLVLEGDLAQQVGRGMPVFLSGREFGPAVWLLRVAFTTQLVGLVHDCPSPP